MEDYLESNNKRMDPFLKSGIYSKSEYDSREIKEHSNGVKLILQELSSKNHSDKNLKVSKKVTGKLQEYANKCEKILSEENVAENTSNLDELIDALENKNYFKAFELSKYLIIDKLKNVELKSYQLEYGLVNDVIKELNEININQSIFLDEKSINLIDKFDIILNIAGEMELESVLKSGNLSKYADKYKLSQDEINEMMDEIKKISSKEKNSYKDFFEKNISETINEFPKPLLENDSFDKDFSKE